MSSLAQLYFTDKDVADRYSGIKEGFEDELKKEAQEALKRILYTSMEFQLQDLTGAKFRKHSDDRVNFRNGYRQRGLYTSFGYLNLAVPRVRSGNVKFNCLQAYKRRTNDVDSMVLKMFLAGVSTNRVKEVLEPLLGPNAISASTVSTISKSLNEQVNKYHSIKLADDYVYLIADGVYFNVKNPFIKKRRCVLVAYGVKSNGIRELIDFELAPHGESELAWQNFFYRLYYRGLEGKNLRLISMDGNKGLKNASSIVFPNANQQHCWAHKLRNVSDKLPKKFQDMCINQARDIYNASDHKGALRALRSWNKTWNPIAPKAVECLNNDIYDLLNFFKEPKSMWIKLRTSNIIERCFREVRRRTRTMSCFNNQDSIHRIIFAIFYRQNKLWERKPLYEITHKI